MEHERETARKIAELEREKKRLTMAIIHTVMGLCLAFLGLYLIYKSVGWEVAAGCSLLLWGDNITKSK